MFDGTVKAAALEPVSDIGAAIVKIFVAVFV
jgi:hypothetical protein